ncbi:hypothetical protein BASA81_003934 [Batrachochytrium salamandrivorans]|nr:hypothetical protein BASA81_003934 [Batrachochytrium salamandrivorans]
MKPSRVGPWVVGEELGRGEFSSVYKGHLESDAATVWALKISPLVSPQTDKKRKETKEQTSCRLLYWENEVYRNYASNHALFPVRPLRHGLVDSDGFRLLALELAPGGTLKDKIRLMGRVSPQTTASVGLRLLSGLEKFHLESWFVYKDIKPENIMLNDRGVVLVDFGLAQRFVDPRREHFAAGGESVGTPLFMSRGVHLQLPPSRRDDLESVGYLLWWMLLGGELPWQHQKSERDILLSKQTCQPPIELAGYFEHVLALTVEDVPNYALLGLGLKKLGGIAHGEIDWKASPTVVAPAPPAVMTPPTVVETEEEEAAEKPSKKRLRKSLSPLRPTRTQPPRRVKRQG